MNSHGWVEIFAAEDGSDGDLVATGVLVHPDAVVLLSAVFGSADRTGSIWVHVRSDPSDGSFDRHDVVGVQEGVHPAADTSGPAAPLVALRIDPPSVAARPGFDAATAPELADSIRSHLDAHSAGSQRLLGDNDDTQIRHFLCALFDGDFCMSPNDQDPV